MEFIQCTDQWISQEFITVKYYTYKTMLFRIAFSYLGNKQDCEDIMQEAFIKLCYHAPDFPSSEDEQRWIIRVTINLCKNHLKSYWNRKKVCLDTIEEYTYVPNSDEVLPNLLKLPEKYKTVIQLYYIVGYRITEIADFLGLSESAIKMRLNRGKKLLKLEMEDDI